MLRLIERYVNFISRLSVSLVPVEQLSGCLTSILFLPVLLLVGVFVGFPIIFGIAVSEKLLTRIWPTSLWVQIILTVVLFVVGIAGVLYVLSLEESKGKKP
jgi:hypothetical protein